jgi:hypothetical protein
VGGWHAYMDVLTICDGGLVGTTLIHQDHTNAIKISSVPKTQMLNVLQPRLFHIGEVTCVVYMTLRIQVRIADLYRMKEVKIMHEEAPGMKLGVKDLGAAA